MFQELILLNHGRSFEGFLCIFLKGFNLIVWLLLSCKDRAFPTKRAIEPQWLLSSTTLYKEVKLTNLVVWIYAKIVEETRYWLVKANEDLRKRKFCIFDWSVDFSKSYKNYCPKLFMWFRNIDNSKHTYVPTLRKCT